MIWPSLAADLAAAQRRFMQPAPDGAVAAHFAGQYLHEQKVDAEQI